MGLCKEKTTSEKSLQWKTGTKILYKPRRLLLRNETLLKMLLSIDFGCLLQKPKNKLLECSKKGNYNQELLFSFLRMKSYENYFNSDYLRQQTSQN